MRLPNGYGGITKLKGNRRRPYRIRVTTGFHFDTAKDRMVQDYSILGYAETRSEALNILANYNQSPYDLSKITFAQVYEKWSEEKFKQISKSQMRCYVTAFKSFSPLHDAPFRELRLSNLQRAIDCSGKNYPSLKKMKVLLDQMYDYAMKYELCDKNYSDFVDILKYKDRNPNKQEKGRISQEQISQLWSDSKDPTSQIILMLIYNGCRIGEFLELKKENINLEEQYFDVIKSKTEAGIRRVPIADKVLPFYREWFSKYPSSEYLIGQKQEPMLYRTFVRSCFSKKLPAPCTPHWTRHTCASMMADKEIDLSIRQQILGHSRDMAITEKVYTHRDVRTLLDAINKL